MNFLFKVCFILLAIGLNQIDFTVAEKNVNNCKSDIVESIPIGLSFNSSVTFNSTFDGLMYLVSNAKHSIDIASYYWTLLGTDVMPNPDPSSLNGKQLFNAILDASQTRSIRIRIAVNDDKNSRNSTDLQTLGNAADIRYVNFTRLVGAGILHTKFIVVDDQHFYIGSANMDWRSLTQVKELGLISTDCNILANDLLKIFDVYWYLGEPNATIPKLWPKKMSTDYNQSHPLLQTFDGIPYDIYFSSSPKEFCPFGRTNDIEAILSIIRNANKFIDIAVMDYFPTFLYSNYGDFWPVIDDALKSAVLEKKVRVRLLASRWNNTRASMPLFLRSLSAFNDTKVFGADIQIKLFVVPADETQAQIPFARVNHNKYMVTDKTGYIGTNNWSADYFVNTGGVGFVFTPTGDQTNLRDSLQSVFDRDWNSIYAQKL